jgi:hypothetical protein
VVFDEFPVELEPRMLEVVRSEPSFDLSERGRFTDAAKDVFDPWLLQALIGGLLLS